MIGAQEARILGLSGAGWRRLALAAAFALAVALPFVLSDYRIFQLTQVVIYAIAILGLNMLTGRCGQISLGHGAFFALGAYSAAILMDQAGVAYYLTLPVAFVICLVVGFLFGFPAGRLRGHYLALATFALAVAVPQILKYDPIAPWTGGVQGIFIFKPEPPFGLPLSTDQWLYLFTLAVAAVMFALAHNLLRGRSGRAMAAIRTHDIAAETMGIDTAFHKSLTFGVSAAYTGLAGALGAIAIEFVGPDSFGFFESIRLVIGMVVGGLGSIWGSVVGGLFIVFVPNLAERVSQAAPWAIYGVFMIAFMYLMPKGVAGFVRMAAGFITRRWARPPPVGEGARRGAAAE